MVEMFKSYNTCTCFYEVKNGHFSLKDEWIAWIVLLYNWLNFHYQLLAALWFM